MKFLFLFWNGSHFTMLKKSTHCFWSKEPCTCVQKLNTCCASGAECKMNAPATSKPTVICSFPVSSTSRLWTASSLSYQVRKVGGSWSHNLIWHENSFDSFYTFHKLCAFHQKQQLSSVFGDSAVLCHKLSNLQTIQGSLDSGLGKKFEISRPLQRSWREGGSFNSKETQSFIRDIRKGVAAKFAKLHALNVSRTRRRHEVFALQRVYIRDVSGHWIVEFVTFISVAYQRWINWTLWLNKEVYIFKKHSKMLSPLCFCIHVTRTRFEVMNCGNTTPACHMKQHTW